MLFYRVFRSSCQAVYMLMWYPASPDISLNQANIALTIEKIKANSHKALRCDRACIRQNFHANCHGETQ